MDACRQAYEQGADLAWAADLAIGQRLSALLWRVVEPWADGGDWANKLRADAQRCVAQAKLVLPRIGDELLAPLNAAGLQPLVWKGASLAERYPAAGDRPMDDVDLLLPADQRLAAVQLLAERGWRVIEQPGEHYEVVMMHPALPGLPVELHEALAMPNQRTFRLSAADLWRSRTPVTVVGRPVFGLPVETELVALVTHAAKPFHTFERLIWSVDLAVVIRSARVAGRPVDWDAVEATATRVRARTALAVALIQAARLGVDSPAHLRVITCRATRREALAPVLGDDWPLHPRDQPTRYRLGYALTDDPRLVARRAAAEVFSNGPVRAPAGAANLVWRAVRRWSESRRTVRRSG